MCEQCLTWPLSFGEPLPGYILMRARRDGNDWKKGEWGLVVVNDPSFTWKVTPTPNPVWGMTNEEEDAWYETADKESAEFKRADRWRPSNDFMAAFQWVTPMEGYELISAAMQVGYDREKHGQFQMWFFDYLAEWLKTAPEEDEGDPFPNREEFAPADLTINRHPHPSEPGWDDEVVYDS